MDIGQRCAIDTGTTAGTILVLATNKRANVCLWTAVGSTLRIPTQGFIIFASHTTELIDTTTAVFGVFIEIYHRQAQGLNLRSTILSGINCRANILAHPL
jgi:hypothetical protein